MESRLDDDNRREQKINDFHETTNKLIKKFFEETNVDVREMKDLTSLHRLILHLNPLARLPDVTSIVGHECEVEKEEAVLEDSPQTNQTCIFCKQPLPGRFLETSITVESATRVLMAGVVEGSMTMDYARETICRPQLHMCKGHTNQVYEMVCGVAGVREAEQVDQMSVRKLKRCLGVYKYLLNVRCKHQNKTFTDVPLADFQAALETFLAGAEQAIGKKSGEPAFLDGRKKNPKPRNVKAPKTVVWKKQMISPNDSLRAVLFPKKHQLRPIDTEGLVRIVMERLKEVEDDEPSTSTPSSQSERDLLFERIQEMRTAERNERYESYPPEMRSLMKPIDDLYEKQAANHRSEMLEIRQRNETEMGVEPRKRAKRTVRDFSQLAQQMVAQNNGEETKCIQMTETKCVVMKEPKQEMM